MDVVAIRKYKMLSGPITWQFKMSYRDADDWKVMVTDSGTCPVGRVPKAGEGIDDAESALGESNPHPMSIGLENMVLL